LYLRLARFRVGERRRLRSKEYPISEVAATVLTSGENPSSRVSPISSLFSTADRVVSRILKDTFVENDSRRLSSQFSRLSSPKRNTVKQEGAEDRKGGTRGRSHSREQQPADWPFYRADRSRLYEESHNGNLRSSLTLPPPSASHPAGLLLFCVMCPLFSFSYSLLLLSSSFISHHILRLVKRRSAKLFGEESKRINAD